MATLSQIAKVLRIVKKQAPPKYKKVYRHNIKIPGTWRRGG